MNKTILLLAFVASAASAADGAARDAPLAGQWATLTIEPQLRRTHIELRFGTLRFDPATKRLEYWIERRERQGVAETTAWAESRTCPAIQPIIGTMRNLAPMRPDPPGFASEDIIVTADGTLYTLEGLGRADNGRSGRFSMSSNVGTPLAGWAERAEIDLRACWSDTIPTTT